MLARGGVNFLPPSSPSPRSGGHDNGGRLDHRDPRNVWDTPPGGGGGILLRGGGTGGGPVGLVIVNGRIVILAYRIFGNSNRQGWGVTTGSGATLVGSIVNATGKKLFSPSGLS